MFKLLQIRACNEVQYIYSSTAHKYNFEVLVFYWTIFILLHYILEGNLKTYLITDSYSNMAHFDLPTFPDPQTLALDVLYPDVNSCVRAVNSDQHNSQPSFNLVRTFCHPTFEAV